MVIKENKELTIMYKEAPKEEAEAEVEEETPEDETPEEEAPEEETELSKAPMSRAAKATADYTVVEVGKTIELTGESNRGSNCSYTHSWESNNSNIATVSGEKETVTIKGKNAGTVEITHKYCDNDSWLHRSDRHRLKTETFTVEVIDSETDPQPEGTERVYVYMKMDPTRVPTGWNLNGDGWYTIGYVDVKGIPSATGFENNTFHYEFQNEVMDAINNGGLKRFSGHANLALDLSQMQWNGSFDGGRAGLKTSNGAADYVEGVRTWHLDGWYDVQKTATVYIKGNQETKLYNGSEQEVTGYEVTGNPNDVPLDSIKLKEGKEAKASGTTVGKYPMGLNGTDFDIPAGYDLVNFIVDDGWLEITPITEKIRIVINGHNKTLTYDGNR